MIMNKNKYVIIIILFLSFFAFKNTALAKSNSLTYNLIKGTMHIYFKVSGKEIVETAVYCDNNQIFIEKMVRTVSEFEETFNISDRLSMGEHYCNIYYTYNDANNNVTKKVFSSDIYVNIMKPSDPKLNACSYIDANDYEKNCKSAGCYYENKSCKNYPESENTENNGSGSNGSGNITEPDEEPFDSGNFCSDISGGLKIAGYTIIIIKIITPLAIILMGSFDFYKAVSSGKQDDLKKQAIMIGNRVLVGLIIFFLPTIIKTTLNFLSGDSEYISCINCLFDPTNSCK